MTANEKASSAVRFFNGDCLKMDEFRGFSMKIARFSLIDRRTRAAIHLRTGSSALRAMANFAGLVVVFDCDHGVHLGE
jgi:hypothetical protein